MYPRLFSGKLAREGFFENGWFRAMKSYAVEPFQQEKVLVRSKGIPKKAREAMDSSHFKITQEREPDTFFQNCSLRPSIGGAMFLQRNSRRLGSSVNMKRKQDEV